MKLRPAILDALKRNPGTWVSGAALSESLGVSRTAVWKQIRHLAEEGYDIESVPRKGYRLGAAPDLLTPEEVRPGLTTRTFGHQGYIHFHELDSTNDHAKRLAGQGAPEGTVVVAEMQSAGRGRRGRTWFSPLRQGIYVSIILRPQIPLQQLARIPLAAAVAVARTLREETGLDARIKWPNDILVHNRKMAGILSEAVADMDGVDYVVVGLGLNVHNHPGEFPTDLRTPATSVQAEQPRAFSRVSLLQGLLYHLEQSYQQLLAGEFDTILTGARDLSMVLGQEIRFESGQGHITGKALDFDGDGCLLVAGPDGSVHTVMSGEIEVMDSGNPTE